MTCVVVTIGGAGDFWKFASVADADAHPIYQHGDAILSSADEVPECFQQWEYPLLAKRLGDAKLIEVMTRMCAANPVLPRDRAYMAEEMWKTMSQLAKAPPTDPAAIVQIVRQDRVRSRTEGITYRKRRGPMTEATTENTEKKSRPIPKDPKYPNTAKISLGSDADGKKYGADNNPKRPGSAAHATFAKYVDGMTVEEAKAAGIGPKDLDYDAGKGFIAIV